MAALTPFVGRAEELAALAATLDRARGGRGAVVTIVGDPGDGKTALVDVALERAGTTAVWSRAREGGGAPPMWLWNHVLRSVTTERPTPTSSAPAVSPTSTGSGVDRFGMFDAVARAILDAHRGPLTIVLDDLQWADGESLAFLDFFRPDAIDHGIVVISTVRRGELAPLPRSDHVIELAGLDREAVAELMASADPQLVEAVWRHTGGNPFFIVEVDRLLRTRARHADGEQWRTIVPEGVRAVLSRQFARLSQRSHRMVIAAAELGEEIDPTLLAAALDAERDEVFDDLAAAADAGLVKVLPDGQFVFAHSLVREAARVELPLPQRRSLNRRAAALLESTRGERAAGQIAQHLFAADEVAAARTWATRAGDAAYAAAMYADAAAWFERVLGASADGDPPDFGLTVRLRYAEALARCGRSGDAEPEFAAVARLARATGDAVSLGRAALGIGSIGGGFEVRLLDAPQQALLAEAIDVLAAGGDSPLLALLMARRSVALSLDAGHDERAALADGAVAMAQRVGDDIALGYALGAWCDAHAGPADIDARTAAATEMIVVATRAGDAELELLARRLAMVAALEAGEIGVVHRQVEAFATLADRIRLPEFCWYARLMEAMLAHVAGNLAEAERLVGEASVLGRQARSANARMLADGALAPIIGRDAGDRHFVDRIIAVNCEIPEATRGADAATGMRLYQIGFDPSPDVIGPALEACVELQRATSIHDGLFLLMAWLVGNGAAFVGDAEGIAAMERALAPFESRFVLDGTGSVCHEPVAAALARLAAAAGDNDLAAERFARAIAAARRIGAPLMVQRLEAEAEALSRDRRPQPATPVPGTDVAGRRGRLQREGDVWLVEFAGAECRLRHSKGLADLAVLVARPDREVHVFDLVAAADGVAAGGEGGFERPDRSDTGPVIDGAARAAYEERIRDLTDQIEEAERRGDDDRAARFDDERAALLTHLASALGLGRRPRTTGSDVERARKAVGMRIRDAIRRIDDALPDLGRHLHSAIRTGTTCSYRPEVPTDWTT